MTPERRLVEVAHLTLCLKGHVVESMSAGERAWEIRCPACGEWTWESNYCQFCGVSLPSKTMTTEGGGR